MTAKEASDEGEETDDCNHGEASEKASEALALSLDDYMPLLTATAAITPIVIPLQPTGYPLLGTLAGATRNSS